MVNEKYLPRIVDEKLNLYLATSGAVLIVGPKWCGKTRTAEEISNSILYMQDPDHSETYKLLAKTKPSKLLEGEIPRLLDEWQVAPVLWNAVRFAVDKRRARGQFILTGSVVPPEADDMHTGTGRISRMTMRTMSLFESGESSGTISLMELFNGAEDLFDENKLSIERIAYILTRGGWPEAVGEGNEKYALQMVYNYLDSVAYQDISKIDHVERNPDRVYSLLRSIARNVSTQASTATLLKDLKSNDEELSDKTVNDYINTLKKLYVIEDLPAWSPHLRSKRAIRTTAKRHFTDPSIATAALRADKDKLLNDFETFGFLFESLCIRDLRIYADSVDGSVYHYRDQLNHEVDAIIQLRDERWAAIEIKMGAGEIEKAAENLINFSKNIDTEKMPAPSFLMVLTGTEYAFQMETGVWVVPIGCLKD
ncbi:ATPase AAA [Clostridia bacterium]|nr:ATPase AAA [Clostridia bacterium]